MYVKDGGEEEVRGLGMGTQGWGNVNCIWFVVVNSKVTKYVGPIVKLGVLSNALYCSGRVSQYGRLRAGTKVHKAVY